MASNKTTKASTTTSIKNQKSVATYESTTRKTTVSKSTGLAPKSTSLTSKSTGLAPKASSSVIKKQDSIRSVENGQQKTTKSTKLKSEATTSKPQAKQIQTNRSSSITPTSMATKSVIKDSKLTTKRIVAPTTATASKVEKSQQPLPLRAKKPTTQSKNNTTGVIEAVKRNSNKTTASNNKVKANAVLDTYHNVTVASPPQKRKETPTTKQQYESKVEEHQKRARTFTRTLNPEEVLVLKRESAKQRIQAQIQNPIDTTEVRNANQIKEPIAFEVNFKDEGNREHLHNTTSSTADNDDKHDDENGSYSDDFESYESDFETGESSTSTTPEDEEAKEMTKDDLSSSSSSESSAVEETNISALDIYRPTQNDDDNDAEQEEEEDDSEPTQNPITVIHRDKELERKLDSGHYDMNSRKNPKLSDLNAQSTQYTQSDSFDTFSMANSEQMDSGISSYGIGIAAQVNNFDKVADESNSFYGGYVEFCVNPLVNKRGLELMRKIQLDSMTYELFEMKPLSYDVYMQSYGKLNTAQASTQTQIQNMTIDCQTDELEFRCTWTQHPPQYDLQTVQQHLSVMNSGGGVVLQNCCGEAFDYDIVGSDKSMMTNDDAYEHSLHTLNMLHQAENQRMLQQQLQRHHKPVDFERLNVFLHNATHLMSKVLNRNMNNKQLKPVGIANQNSTFIDAGGAFSSISKGYQKLDAGFLNALCVRRIFGNERHNIIITVHECLPGHDVYREDFSNLLMIWSTTEVNKPLRLLSTWAEVCRAEISNDCADIVVCGLRDGSVAMWDLRETYTYCSKLDGYLTHFAATQSIVPTISTDGDGRVEATRKLLDLGAVVDVRSFRVPEKMVANNLNSYKPMQFASLNDSGILVVWTLIEHKQKSVPLRYMNNQKQTVMNRNKNSIQNNRFEYTSPWSRVRLIQSAICDLRLYLEHRLLKSQNQYHQTKTNFQNNIYSDELLRELNETQTLPNALQGQGLQGIRFTNIDTGCERIYVCTNRNFILSCTKSLKPERFNRIAINESRFLFPTVICVLTNEDFLAVGLSNGSVIILNCNQQRVGLNLKQHTNQTELPLGVGKITITQNPDIIELETGKSCAIQNIILNERRSFEADVNYIDALDEFRPSTSACIDLINNQRRPFELHVYDQQLLLSGSALRKHLVQSLVLSSDGWRLFALANGALRVYDFYLDREISLSQMEDKKSQHIKDIAVGRTTKNAQHLVLMRQENIVELHMLNQ